MKPAALAVASAITVVRVGAVLSTVTLADTDPELPVASAPLSANDFAPSLSGLLAVSAALWYAYVVPPTTQGQPPDDNATAVAPPVTALTSAVNEPVLTPLPPSVAFAYTR